MKRENMLLPVRVRWALRGDGFTPRPLVFVGVRFAQRRFMRRHDKACDAVTWAYWRPKTTGNASRVRVESLRSKKVVPAELFADDSAKDSPSEP